MEGRDPRDPSAPPPPAPEQRATDDEVRRQAEVVRESPIVRALLEWLAGFAMVLNDQRQILLVSDAFLQELGVEDAASLVGQRLGEALGCVYPGQGPSGCGTSQGCRYCGMLQALRETRESQDPWEAEYRVTLAKETGDQTRKFRVRVAPITISGESFQVLLLQQPTTEPHTLDWQATASFSGDDDRWPDALERFTRLRKLGTGGMGTVYLVADKAQRPFAVKLIRVPERTSPAVAASLRLRFQQETEVGLALSHPNIVKTFEAEKISEELAYLVCEFCPSGATSTILQRRGPLPVDVALFWMIGAARGLDYAWRQRKIVHRDIKPDNLLIGQGFLLKIADFGIARQHSSGAPHLTTPGAAHDSGAREGLSKDHPPDRSGS